MAKCDSWRLGNRGLGEHRRKRCRLFELTNGAIVYERYIGEAKTECGLRAIISSVQLCTWSPIKLRIFCIFFGGLKCVSHFFAYVAHLWFLWDVWTLTQSAAVASGRAINLATHPPRICVMSHHQGMFVNVIYGVFLPMFIVFGYKPHRLTHLLAQFRQRHIITKIRDDHMRFSYP